jgi:hypothetical protein
VATQGTPLPFLIFAGAIFGGLGIFSIYSAFAAKKRSAAMRSVAQTMGFIYEEKPDIEAIGARLEGLLLFNRGHSRVARRLLRGNLAGRETSIVDYRYTTGGGKNAQTHGQTVVVFQDGAKGLPAFQLAPEGFLHGLAEMFGAQDIDFEQSHEFSKRYLLKGPDEAAIRKAFTIDVLAWFAGAPGWSVQTGNDVLLVFRGERYVTPAEIPALAAEALRIAGLFKT